MLILLLLHIVPATVQHLSCQGLSFSVEYLWELMFFTASGHVTAVALLL